MSRDKRYSDGPGVSAKEARDEELAWRPFDYDDWQTATVILLANNPVRRAAWVRNGWLNHDGSVNATVAGNWLSYLLRGLGKHPNGSARELAGNTLHGPTTTELVYFGTDQAERARHLANGKIALGRLGIRAPSAT